MEKQLQIGRRSDKGLPAGRHDGTITWKRPAGQGMRARLEPLDMNGYIKRLAQSISPELKEEIGLRANIGDGTLPVVADPARISVIFAALVACGTLLSGGGSVTVLTALVPLGAGRIEKETGNGCALLSFRVERPRGTRLPSLWGRGRDRVLPALFNVRSIVGRYHGCFRLSVRENAVVFSVYLPVIQGSPGCGVERATAFGGTKEGA
jgi:hypothetical protein